MKHFRRVLCLLLSALMLTSSIPVQALEGPMPELLPPVVPEEGSIAAGVFYLGCENAELAEDGGSRLLLIGRSTAETLPEAQVRLVMTDITAHYGEDYTVREYQGSAKTENAKDSIALIDVILENADELEAYNNTDVLVETGVLPEAGTESEDTGELSDEEMAEMNAAMHEALYGEEEVPAVLNDSLRQAKSVLTGIKSDRVPMTNSAADGDITDRLLETFSEDLNCAYLTLSFDEGETEKYIELTPKNNIRGDGDRMFNLTLTPESNGAAVSGGSGMTVTIRDDEEQKPAVISFTSSEYHPENGYVRVALKRSGAENQTVSVRLTTEDGSAAEGENYSGVDATVVFPFGVKENYVNIPVSSKTVEDEADFSLSLSEPRGAVLGATPAAGVTILSADASFTPQLAAADYDLPLGETMKGFQYAYNCRHSSDSGAKSKVTKEEDDVEGETIKLFADWPTWNCSGSTWCGCNLQMNKTDDFLQTVFYEGVRIRGKASSDADDDDDLRVRVDQEDKNGNISTGVHALYDDLDNYKSKKNIDVYFKSTLYCDDLYVEVYRDDGDSRSFRIYEWAPILRPFTVKLLQADPLQFYDADGNLRDNTAIAGLEHANQAVLQLPNATGTEGTFYYGDTIDVLRKEDSGAVTKLTGFNMVKKDDDNAAPLVLAYGEPTDSKSLTLDMDAPYIYDFITPSYWDIDVGGDDTARKGMYNTTAYIKPTFTYIDTELKIYGDDHGAIGFTNGTYKGTGSDTYGDYTLYTIHQGDYVHLKPTVNDVGYTTNGVRVMTESAVGSEEFTQYVIHKTGDPSDGYARFRNGSYTQIRVFPEITERSNAIRVQVNKTDASAFKNLGMFADSTVTATKTDCGSYDEYTVVPADRLVPGQYYTLSAFPTAGTAEWVVTPAGSEVRTYCQNTFVFRAQRDASHNIVRLKAPSLGGTVQLSADLTVLVQQPQIGGTEVYTIPAENALVVLDEEHIGLLDENGSVSFSGASATASSQELWRRICISYGGRSFYEDLKIPASAAGSSVRLTPSPITINVTDGLDRPVLSDVTASDEYGTVSAYIAIDGTKRIFTAYVGRDGTEYTDTTGLTREENITGVKFVVVDPDSGERKMVLAGQKKDAKTWQAEWTLYSGYEDKYAVGDQVWVELTTDRVVGDGKAYVNGSTGEKNDYLRQTVYPLLPTKLVFTASIPAEQPPQNIALPDFENVMDGMPDENGRYSNGGSLPFIENFSFNMNLGRIKISMTPHPVDSSKIVVSFGVGIINKGILNKDYKGWYQPSQNPDPDLLKRLDDTEKRMGAKKFGYAGRFFGKPKWDVSVGLNLILKPSAEVSGGYDIESGVLFVAVNASISYNAYFLIVVVPVYFCGQVSGQILAGAKFSSDVPLDISTQFFEHMQVSFQTSALVSVDIYAGVGLAGVIGARGGINFTLNFLYDSGIEDMTPVGLQFRIFGKVWVDLFVKTLDYRWEIIDPLTLGYYKDAADALKGSESNAMLSVANRAEDYQIHDKILDEEDSEWLGGSGSVTAIPYGGSATVLLRNGYDWADPQLLYMGEDYGTLLVFVDKRTGDTNGIDNTVLKYSVLQGTTWSQPKVLYETETADFQPSLCDMGDRVLISWVSRNPEVDPASYDGDVNQLLEDLDVYTVEYVKEDSEVDETSFTRLTDDDYFNSEPQAVYVPDTSDTMVFFQKSEVALRTPAPLLMASSGTSNISSADSLYLSNVLPTANNCEIAYMVRSGGEWSRDYEPEQQSGLLTASQARALRAELGGQRFLSTPIHELDTNDPLLTDLDTVAFEKYVLYAFSVDADNDLATGSDRAVYLQVYDTETGMNYDPVRVRDTDVIQSNPQILLRPDDNGVEPMLFWLEDSENVCYTGLLPYLRTVIKGDSTFATEVDFTNPDNLFALGGVFFGSLDPAKKPSLNGYNACTDSEGNLYITWSQPVYEGGKCIGQEVFASAQIITDTPGENDNGVSWSEGVQLTYSGKTNDQQAITVDGDSRIIVVNNQLELDMENDAYAPKNIMMVASILYPACMLEVTDLTVSNETPKAGETVTVRGNIKNTGLLPADGYKVEELGGYTTPIDGSNTPIVPSGKKPFSFDMTIPGDGTLPTLTFLLYQAYKSGSFAQKGKTAPISLFRSAPVYAITDAHTVQEGDTIYLECTVANHGNAASDDSGAVLHVGRNNVNMDFDAGDTAYLEIPMDTIPVGEAKLFREMLTIPDADFIDKTAYAYVCVADGNGEWLTKPVSLYVSRTVTPTAISIPGAVNGALRLSAGQTKSLRGVTCRPAASADSARFLYTVDDSSVAVVENGLLRAVNGGSADLTVTVLPSGERFIVPLMVDGHGHTPPKPKPEPDPVPEKPQKTEECFRDDNCPLRVYSDLDPWEWYHDGVEFCLKNRLMVGIAEDTFAPASTTTRGMMMTILARMEGADGSCTPWYAKGREWAMAAGVSDGTDPESTVTREQFVSMMFRYAGYKGLRVSADASALSGFADVSQIDGWALSAMEWACSNDVLNGKDNGILDPCGPLTRAEAAAIIERYCRLIAPDA